MKVRTLDHIVFTVADVERSLAWYGEELGLEPLRVEAWRAGEISFPSVRIDQHTIIDLVAGERRDNNVEHVCLVVDDVDLDELATTGRFTVVEGPANRWGARGDGRSLYVHDPDTNVIEFRTYPEKGQI